MFNFNMDLPVGQSQLVTSDTALAAIGTIGIGADRSQASLAAPMQMVNDPLIRWLENTPASRMIRSRIFNDLSSMKPADDGSGDIIIELPSKVGTTEFASSVGECCIEPVGVLKCDYRGRMRRICVQHCQSLDELLILNKRKFGSNDLAKPFGRQGGTLAEAKTRAAKDSYRFVSVMNAIQGDGVTETPILKRVDGVLEIMTDIYTPQYPGINILGAFDSIGCGLEVYGTTEAKVFATNPVTLYSIKKQIKPGPNGKLPDDWSVSANGELHFKDIRFIASKAVPVDLDLGYGEVWLLDGNYTGVFAAGGFRDPLASLSLLNIYTEKALADGCGAFCDKYFNYIGVFNFNKRSQGRIYDVPINANCLGGSLQGLDGLVNPTTLIPMV